MTDDTSIEMMTDDEVLALAAMQMPEDQQRELSDLLADQREGVLTAEQRTRLDALMQVYRHGMVRKAEATKVAVERRLIPSLSQTN